MKKYFKYLQGILLLVWLLSSCGMQNKKTTIEIIDPDRHYYPVIRGEELDILFRIKNTGTQPLFISDIHTSCGCLLIDESSFKVLPAGSSGFLKMKYDSNKNVGYVKHYVMIYANLEDKEYEEVIFDVNVVPNALYTQDYEELYTEIQKKRLVNTKHLVDGDPSQLGYYVGDSLEW